MEYVEGQSLDEAAANRRFSPATAADYVWQAASGLARAHENNVVHGDVNPTHLLLDGSGTIKVSGLGVARLTRRGDAASSDTSLSEFAAPEVVSGSEADARSDVYSLGATLHLLLTGSASDGAFHGAATVPTSLQAICDRMQAADPNARFQTAGEAAGALEVWLSDNRKPASQNGGNGRVRIAGGKPPQTGSGDFSTVQLRHRRKLAVAKPLAPSAVADAGLVAAASNARDSESIHIDIRSGSSGGSSAKVRNRGPRSGVGKKRAVWPLVAAAVGAAVLVFVGLGAGGIYIVWTQFLNAQPAPGSGTQNVALNTMQADSGDQGSADTNDSADKGSESDRTGGGGAGETTTDKGADTQPTGDSGSGDSTPPDGSGTDDSSNGGPAVPPENIPPDNGGTSTPDPDPGPTNPETTPPVPPPDPPTDPEPPPPVSPFEGLPTAVALPPLKSGQTPDAELPAQELVPLRLAPSAVLSAQIEGGETASRGAYAFSLRREEEGDTRSWQVILTSGSGASASAAAVARLAATDDALQFEWLEAAESETAANYLRNCILRLRSDEFTHALALRTPVTFDELAVSLDRALSKSDVTIEWLPDPKAIQIEIVELQSELLPYRFDPKQTLEAARDATWIYLGPPEKDSVLGLKIDSRVSRTVRVEAAPYFKVASEPKEIRFSPAEAKKVSAKLTIALPQMQARKTQYDQLPEPQKTANQANAMLLDQQIATAQTALIQLADLQTYYEEIGDSCRVRLRVFFLAGETQVELAHTAGAPPPSP